jgi:hypothetical protein
MNWKPYRNINWMLRTMLQLINGIGHYGHNTKNQINSSNSMTM